MIRNVTQILLDNFPNVVDSIVQRKLQFEAAAESCS